MQIQVYHLYLFQEKKWTREMREVTVDKPICLWRSILWGSIMTLSAPNADSSGSLRKTKKQLTDILSGPMPRVIMNCCC